jgi:hypothetical protein
VATTVFLVRIALRFLARVKFARKVPTWVYAIVIASALTVFARYVLHSITGDVWDLIYQALMNAASASGFQSWLSNYNTPLHETAGIDLDGDGKPDVEDVEQPIVGDDEDEGSMRLE